jgi:hypothetical protein
MDERVRRIGENEVLFREVNEKIDELDRTFSATPSSAQSFLCECGRRDCTARVTLTPEQYAAVREDPARFVVVPGHEAEDVETVVDEGDGYFVIQKREGEPAEIAAAHDPRK